MLATVFAWALAAALSLAHTGVDAGSREISPDTSTIAPTSPDMDPSELATRRACRLLVRLLDSALAKGGGAYRRYSGYLIADYIRLVCIVTLGMIASNPHVGSDCKCIFLTKFESNPKMLNETQAMPLCVLLQIVRCVHGPDASYRQP